MDHCSSASSKTDSIQRWQTMKHHRLDELKACLIAWTSSIRMGYGNQNHHRRCYDAGMVTFLQIDRVPLQQAFSVQVTAFVSWVMVFAILARYFSILENPFYSQVMACAGQEIALCLQLGTFFSENYTTQEVEQPSFLLVLQSRLPSSQN